MNNIKLKTVFNRSMLTLIGLLIVASCSQFSSKEKSTSPSMTVDFEDKKQRSLPKVDKNKSSNQFGPRPTKSMDISSSGAKHSTADVWAIIISAGGYRTLASIALLKELKIRKEVPQVIMGHGLSAIVAAYLAFGYEPDYIEWKFFKFISAASEEDIYSEDWINEAEDILLEEFKGKSIEDAKLTLILPYKKSGSAQKVQFLKRGELIPVLKANLNVLELSGLGYEQSFSTKLFERSELETVGVKRVVLVDLISSGISWKKSSGLLNGTFQKAASTIIAQKDQVDTIIKYELDQYPLDDSGNVANLVFMSKKQTTKSLELILKKEDSL